MLVKAATFDRTRLIGELPNPFYLPAFRERRFWRSSAVLGAIPHFSPL